MKGFLFACVIALCIAVSLQSTPGSPCSNGPMPLDLRVEGCTKLPCVVSKGQNVKAEWDFAAVADAKGLKPRVKVKVMGSTVEFPYPEQDACKSLTKGECPLEKGDEATYSLDMPIPDNIPSVRVNIEFALLDELKNIHVCFKLDARIK